MAEPIERFNQLAEQYEEFSETIPNKDTMNEVTQELLQQWFSEHPTGSICELGTGTGTMARTLVDEFQPESYLALDGAENMVQQTRQTFEDYSGPTDVRIGEQPFETWDPDGIFDCVYSSLSIHHLTRDDKQKLFRTIFHSLSENGLFVYADIFEPPESLEEFYFQITRTRRLNLGMSEEEFEDRWQSHLENDLPSDWRDTMDWLGDAGFSAVDCAWKNVNFAIFLAIA